MNRGILLVAVFTVIVLFSFQGSQSYGETDTTIYSMTVFADSRGSMDYDYMTWDFGDGTGADSRLSEDALNPVHTYGEPGRYTIVQTVYNTSGKLMTDSTSITVNVMGPAPVTLMSGDAVFAVVFPDDRTGKEYNPVSEPEGEPEADGLEFAGWIASDGLPYDWSSPVAGPLTLYASWEPADGSEANPGHHPGRGDGGLPIATALAVVVGTLVLVAYLRRS